MTATDHERRDQNRTRRRLQQHKRLRGGLALGLAAAALLSTAGTVFAGPGPAPADAAPDGPLLSPVSLVQPSGSARPAEAEGGPVPAAEAREQAAQEQAAAQKAADRKAAAEEAADRKAAGAAAEKAARAKAAAGKPVDDPAAAKAYAAGQLPGFGWDASQMPCLDTLWDRESDWTTSATNPSSGAYGIVQSLPGEKMATAGPDWRTNYETQIDWGLDYIDGRYGSPCAALQHHDANNWY